jgi:hypothetical protein
VASVEWKACALHASACRGRVHPDDGSRYQVRLQLQLLFPK